MSIIGLCGAHRVGKSTLAKAFAENKEINFLQTSASRVFFDLGFDPAGSYDFRTRLTIQEAVLDYVDMQYAAAPVSVPSVTDRTPVDMLAYTLAEAYGERVSDADQERLAAYTRKCIDITNKRFSLLFVVQPGIPLVYEDGKAALNTGYIEHLNSLILGLTVDERITIPHFFIHRPMTDIKDRIKALEYAVGRTLRYAEADRAKLSDSELH